MLHPLVRLLAAVVLFSPAPASAQDSASPSLPLLPHPSESRKPVYSQDHYSRNPVPEEPQQLEEAEVQVYTQDKFFEPEMPEDRTDQLRKVPEKGHEWSEIEIAKGAVALNVEKFDDAIAHFRKALKYDPRNFVAIEYMASTQERKGDLPAALAYLAKAKHIAPKGRWGQINFQMGRLYLMLKNHERAEIYLKLALSQGGQPTAVNYTLGYLMYLEKRWFEAEGYLHESRMRAIRLTALPPERKLLQAIDYYLGEVYARLGFIDYSIVMLRETENGDSWEVRNTAWRVHAEINHPQWYVTLGDFGQYDSNVLLIPVNGFAPLDFTGQSGVSSVFLAKGGWQTTPAAKWVLGVDSSVYENNHVNSSFSAFDVLDLGFDLWGMFWNRQDWSFVARYEFNDALTQSWNFTRFQSSNALGISAHYFPFQRWDWEFGFQYRLDDYATDQPNGADQRSGFAYIGFLKATVKAPNPRFRPTFGYTFENDAANGINFQSRNHTFSFEADYRVFSRTHLVAGLFLTKSFFPSNLNGRLDTTVRERLGLNQIFSEHWVGVLEGNSISDTSTQANFSYDRLTFTMGATYTF